MSKIRGFRIRHKLLKAIKLAIHRRRKQANYQLLNSKSSNYTEKAMSKLCKFGQSLKKTARDLCFQKPGSKYTRIGGTDPVPKGHLAVYVGEKEDDAHRVLVPVIYFNHPLFGDLLREAEKVYGFNHRGGIHVPCRISEFQNVQTKISAAGGGCVRGGDGFRSPRSWRLTL